MKKKDFVIEAYELEEIISELTKLRDKYIEIALMPEIKPKKEGEYEMLEALGGVFLKGCEGCPLKFMEKFSAGGEENE